jgi:hypothetical protein
MELIFLIATVIISGLSAIGGHFVAHDLYAAAPKHAKRLLQHAVRTLPEADRDRYAEEWQAHLLECEGVIGKYKHAMECFLIARKLRQIVQQRTTFDPHAIEFVFFAKGQMIRKVSMDTTTAYPVLKILEEAQNLNDAVAINEFVPTDEIKALLKKPDVKRDRILEMQAAVERTLASGQPEIKIRVVDQFGRVMTTKELEEWIEEQD